MPAQIEIAACAMQLELLDEQRNSLHREMLTRAVFARAMLATRFDAFRRHLDDVYRPTTCGAVIEPLFVAGGDPRCHGFRVRVELPNGSEHSAEFPLRYFYARACATWEALSKRQSENADSASRPWAYQLLAYLNETETDGRSRRSPVHGPIWRRERSGTVSTPTICRSLSAAALLTTPLTKRDNALIAKLPGCSSARSVAIRRAATSICW